MTVPESAELHSVYKIGYKYSFSPNIFCVAYASGIIIIDESLNRHGRDRPDENTCTKYTE